MKKIASLFYFSSNITRLPKRAPGNTSRVQRPYSKKHEIMRWDLTVQRGSKYSIYLKQFLNYGNL